MAATGFSSLFCGEISAGRNMKETPGSAYANPTGDEVHFHLKPDSSRANTLFNS
jgi:hypothetical protein